MSLDTDHIKDTEEEWKKMSRVPYKRDFSEILGDLAGSLISSEETVNHIFSLGGGIPDGWKWGQYLPTSPCMIRQYMIDLFKQTDKRPGHSFCDLGIGTEFPMAAFAAAGFKTYGVDISQKELDYAEQYFERAQKELGRFRYAPVTKIADITSQEFSSLIFPDGKPINSMDVLFCYAGDDHRFHRRAIHNIQEIKKGCVWLEYFIFHLINTGLSGHPRDRPNILDTSFRAIDTNYFHSLLIAR